MLPTEFPEVWQASHAAVSVHDLTKNGPMFKARQPGQVDATLGMACADEHAPFLRPQPVDMALAANEIVGSGFVGDGHLYGPRPVKCRRSGCDAGTGVDGRRERRRLSVHVVSWKRLQM